MSTEIETKGYQFGTFKGVFTPSLLTILGVIMYLRMGWMLGQVGITSAIVIITLSSLITFMTGLSLAALATNMKIEGGGAYYIISRSLGLEAGAAIGIPLYLAQAVGISFYIAGFSETVSTLFPFLNVKLIGIVTLVGLTGLVYVSADLALKSQFVIMGAIILSLVSFFAGGAPTGLVENPDPEKMVKLGFWAVFAVFFPAVTGIEAGIAMSGDLKNPRKSLPVGTILAVLIGYLIYLAIPLFLHQTVVDERYLLTDPLIMQKVSRWGPLVILGIWGASLSSAMGSLLGAPRTLQALAKDRVLPVILGRGWGPGNDPRLATSLSFAIALTGILLGDLNLIAPVLSMFFLTSYGTLNLSAGLEELVSNPHWRPQFRTPSLVGLAGFFACTAVMIQINFGATLMAGLIVGGIYYLMKRRSLQARWGDMRLGVMMFGVREILFRMEGKKLDERTWKPNILVLSGAPSSRWYLVELADSIAQGKSFITIVTLIPEKFWSAERSRQLTESIRKYLHKNHIRAFIRALPADDPMAGAQSLVRYYGLGPIEPNTVLLGETEKTENFVEYARLILTISSSNKNILIVRSRHSQSSPITVWDHTLDPERIRNITVWWSGSSRNLGFMLALAYQLKMSNKWSSATLNLKKIAVSEDSLQSERDQLNRFIETSRIPAQSDVLLKDGEEIFDQIRRSSSDSDLVFLGIRPPEENESPEKYSLYYADLLKKTDGMPVVALALASENVEFLRIFH